MCLSLGSLGSGDRCGQSWALSTRNHVSWWPPSSYCLPCSPGRHFSQCKVAWTSNQETWAPLQLFPGLVGELSQSLALSRPRWPLAGRTGQAPKAAQLPGFQLRTAGTKQPLMLDFFPPVHTLSLGHHFLLLENTSKLHCLAVTAHGLLGFTQPVCEVGSASVESPR